MKRLTVILLLLALALPAFAADRKDSQINEPTPPPQIALVVIAEVEPNDNSATASGPLTGGDQGTGAVSPSGDSDYWTLNVTGTGNWTLATAAGAAPIINDTLLYLYAADGTTQLAFDDDSGPGLYSLITYNFTATGTYYVRVAGYSTNTGGYVLDIGSPVLPPPNDTCAGAIAIPFITGYAVATTTAGAANDYNPPTGCTGYSANAGDIVYTVTMAPEQEITLTWGGPNLDASIYIVTDCSMTPPCVAGADEDFTIGGIETVGFQNTTGVTTTYYIICDAYTGSGAATLTITGAVATEGTTWGTVKALYR